MNWFQERLNEDFSQMLAVSAELYRGHTGLQEVVVFRNSVFGNVFALDGVVQLTDRDSHIYHEMIAHVPMIAHGLAARVLIVGGGDGGVLHEVLKHDGVERVTLVELDRGVIDLARRYFPQVSDGAFDDPRVTVEIGDGAVFVAETEQEFDLIVVDSTDPIGPGEVLFGAEFYENCRARLRPGGMIAVQGGAAFFQFEKVEALRRRLAECFGAAVPYFAPVPTYAAGMLALIIAGASEQAILPNKETMYRRSTVLRGRTRYYSPLTHQAAFMVAEGIRNAPATSAANPTSGDMADKPDSAAAAVHRSPPGRAEEAVVARSSRPAADRQSRDTAR